jgi:hypothetical protein
MWQRCHVIIIIIGVGVAACHSPVVIPLGQHPHIPSQAVAHRLGGDHAGNIIETPPSHVWSKGGGCCHRKRTETPFHLMFGVRGSHT